MIQDELRENFEELTFAIIKQAIWDYYKKCYPWFTDSPHMPSETEQGYISRLKRIEKKRQAERRSLQDFFLGDFYSRRMPALKGTVLMEEIEIRRRHMLPLFDGK